jgi:asparagine synthase (glutamine-hydrolysing)
MSVNTEPRQLFFDGIPLIRAMGPRWICVRACQAAQNKLRLIQRRLPIENWDQKTLSTYLRADVPCDPAEYRQWRQTEGGKFFFDNLPQSDLLSEVSRGQAVGHAEALLKGSWNFFGMLSVDAGTPPDWHRNPLSGESAPKDPHWAEIPDFAFGDIKLIWEASRFTPAYALVRAFAFTKDDRYAEAFWTLVEDWAVHNPPQCGPNWKCGQESSFRLMAWCFGLYGFLTSQRTTPERIAALSKMIAVTADRIEAYIGYALSQNNNHGISEALGLFSAGTLFPEFRRADSWRRRGKRLLEDQAKRQIYSDGAYVQHSMNYHRVVLQDYIWALRLAELNGEPFARDLYAQILRSTEFLDNVTDTHSGNVPNYGNNDGTLALPLSDCDYSDFRPTLQAAYYLTRHQRRFAPGYWDEMMLWLFGAESLNVPLALPATPASTVSSSGYYILRGDESWAMIRCAEYRDRPAQSDQLHFDLWWRGLNMALDSGTYSYNAPPPWDNAFVNAAAHNTITVDGQDPMRRFSRFLWLDWAQASNVHHSFGNESDYWRGEHDGYQRLGVIHRRTIERRGDTWKVIDEILGNGRHRARLHWLFADFPSVIDSEAGTLRLKTPQGHVIVTTTCSAATNITMIRAGQSMTGEGSIEITRGWVSHTYAMKEPALSLALETEAQLPIRFETRFEFANCGTDDLQSVLRFAEVDR